MQHNALAVLLSVFFLTSSSSALYLLPLQTPPSPRSLPPPQTPLQTDSLASKCTFTLWHKQIHRSSTSVNYIQLNTLIDHANELEIDLAHLRQRNEHNSYSKVSARQVFAVEGLLDDKNLTIRSEDGSDVLKFESNGLGWGSEGGMHVGEAWCVSGVWVGDAERSRERKLECAFPCAKIEDGGDQDGDRAELR